MDWRQAGCDGPGGAAKMGNENTWNPPPLRSPGLRNEATKAGRVPAFRPMGPDAASRYSRSAAGAPDEAVETYFRAFNRHLYGN